MAPTGYTAPVAEGKITEFTEFAATCARAFGAFIDQRDEPAGPANLNRVTEYTYNQERLAKLRAELEAKSQWTAKEWDAAAEAHYIEEAASYERSKAKKAVEFARYTDMLTAVDNWRAPSSDHENFKQFMHDQLVQSIDFDCSMEHWSIPKRKDASEYAETVLDGLKQSIEYTADAAAKEQERNASKVEWVRALRESLVTA